MSGNSERAATRRLREVLPDTAKLEVHPLDVEEACRRYAEDGYEVTPRLREFLEDYGEITVTCKPRASAFEVTTSVERTLESTHAMPRNMGFFARRLGRPVLLIGTAFETEECLLLAENGDILLYGDAGFQQVADSFENAIHALAAGDWDKTFF